MYSMGSISGISSSLLQSSLFQSTGATGNVSVGGTSQTSSLSDSNQLSPLARLLGDLQALQQTDPAKYKDVTSQIAAKLKSAADADTASGNTSGASQLNQLASDFNTASSTGQLPNIQDLAKAAGGGHHHHHGHGGPPPASQDNSADSAANQLLTAYQSSPTQSASANPLSIILNTLQSSS